VRETGLLGAATGHPLMTERITVALDTGMRRGEMGEGCAPARDSVPHGTRIADDDSALPECHGRVVEGIREGPGAASWLTSGHPAVIRRPVPALLIPSPVQVWQATDTQLNRQVALKILPDAFADDPDRLARFQREAEVLASLNHPNIAQIHGIEKAESTRALVLELVEGPTLADRIRRGRSPWMRHSPSRNRSPRPWRRRTRPGSSTETSSPPTSRCGTMGRSRYWTSRRPAEIRWRAQSVLEGRISSAIQQLRRARFMALAV
jgi:hypothetical protein